MLWADKKKRRPIAYDKTAGNITSTWYSRSMGLFGTLILLFLVLHLAHFWIPSRFTGLAEYELTNGEKKDIICMLKCKKFSLIFG